MVRKALLILSALTLLVLGATGIYVWRTLPQLDGEMKLHGLRAQVQIRRDSSDVTHIQAQSPQDVWFALGLVHAQERSWQLSFNRRVMHGTLSEILGPATLETDRLLRTLDIMGAARRQYAALPKVAQEALQRYSDGINAFHQQSTQALPPEFHALVGSKPRGDDPVWTPQDSVGWALMMALDLGGNWGAEMARLSLLQTLNTHALWQLMPPYPGEKPLSSVDLAELYRGLGVYRTATATGSTADHVVPESAWARWSQDLVNQMGEAGGKGSNNWALAGNRTISGLPLLANDPHLGLSAPAIWYFASLQAPAGQATDGTPIGRLQVMGATLPGLPFVVLGRTEGVAWAFTNTGPDVQDLYLERIHPEHPTHYQTPQGWKEFETRQETIRVKGQADVMHTVRRTRHGPVISDAVASTIELIDSRRFAIALRWSALDDDNRTVLGGLLANQAHDVDGLFAAFAHHHSPMQSAIAADTRGTIRMRAIGRVPVRHPANDLRGLAPAPGWDARYDWQGELAYQDNPQDLGDKGWIATANQRITEPDYPHHLTQDWILPYRQDRIVQGLASKERHDMASLQDLQNDVYSAAMLRLWLHLLKVKSNHPLAESAMAVLKHFDGRMLADQAAPLIGAVWVDELARGIIAAKIGSAKFKALYGKRDFRAGIEGILERNDNDWCGPSGCSGVTQKAFEQALDRITAWQGPRVTDWQWGRTHMARSMHRPFDKVDALSSLFNVERPSSGDNYTVNVGQYHASEVIAPFANRHAASLRAIYDLSDLERSVFIYQTGQSGLVFSPRYRDMADEWAQGRYRALQFRPDLWRHELKLQPH
ncbi:MAG: penicillin acylase family protein [Alphaproteobacteria bacterium]|nr:penicillin acylase family protein [Alphaproteobacteria bacterium]